MDVGGTWTIIVPVKGNDAAKSRLAVPPEVRARLAQAFALDTLLAVRHCPLVSRVLVLTADAQLRERLAPSPDPAAAPLQLAVQPPGESLNDGLDRTIATIRSAEPDSSVAVVVGDLPAARATDLTALLSDATDLGPCVVADRGGTGTTALALPKGSVVATAFGPDSLARHVASGAHPAQAADALRCDIDTNADLAAARRLGVGPATRDVLDAGVTRLPPVQATVASFDESTGDGAVLLDDGLELPFDQTAFARSGLRLLRLGQRVRIELDAGGRRVVALNILTLA